MFNALNKEVRWKHVLVAVFALALYMGGVVYATNTSTLYIGPPGDPTNTLTEGDAEFDGDVFIEGSLTAATITPTGDMVLTGDLTVTGAGSLNSDTTDDDWKLYGNDGTAIFSTDAANLRVGINDETPSYDLDVNGDIQVVGTSNLDAVDVDGAADFAAAVTLNSGTADIDTTINGNDNVPVLFVDASALSVGIGDTSPDAVLDIQNGGFIANGNTADLDSFIYGNDNTPLVQYDAGNLSADFGYDIDVGRNLDADTLAAVSIVASNSIDSQGTLTAVTANLEGPVTVNGDTTDDDTKIYGNDETAIVHVDGGDLRVGINDITPSYTLDVNGIIAGTSVIVGSSLVMGGTAISLTPDQINAVYYHNGQPAVGTIDFTGVCSDGDTVTIGSRIYEFDDVDGASCTGSEDVCIDVSGGASAAQCGTALVAGINGDASRSADSILSTDIVSLIGVAVNDAYTLTETGANISVSSAAGVNGEAAGSHTLYHCDHAVTATEQTALGGATGAITTCGVASTSLPNLIQCDVVDSTGQAVTISNTSFNITQLNSNYYAVIVKDSGGGNDIDSTDRVQCLIIVHN
jgi:hypothetical protein